MLKALTALRTAVKLPKLKQNKPETQQYKPETQQYKPETKTEAVALYH